MIMTCTGWAFIAVQLTCTMPDPAPAVVCPPVRTWSRDFQRRVAEEMRARPDSALAAVAIQSIGDRDLARACAQGRRTKRSGGDVR